MNKPKPSSIKLGLITSAGGHLYKTYRLKPWWKKYNRFWVTDPITQQLGILNQAKVYYGHFPETRNLINFIKNLLLAWKILNQEKPDILFSAGAGIAPPFFLIAKFLGIKTIFMVTFVFVPETTLSGQMLYPLADHFIVQNKKLLKRYPKAKYWGNCL